MTVALERLDVAMPNVSGLEALKSLAGLPDGPRVILLTAAIDKPDIVKALIADIKANPKKYFKVEIF